MTVLLRIQLLSPDVMLKLGIILKYSMCICLKPDDYEMGVIYVRKIDFQKGIESRFKNFKFYKNRY